MLIYKFLFKILRGLYHPTSVLLNLVYKKNIGSQNVKHILISKIDGLGDYMMALRAIISIRKNFPDAKITQVVSSQNIHIAQIISTDNICYESPFFYPYKVRALAAVSIISKIREVSPDLFIDLRGDFFLLAATIFSNPTYRIEIGHKRLYSTIIKLFVRNGSAAYKRLSSVHETDVYNKLVLNSKVKLASLKECHEFLENKINIIEVMQKFSLKYHYCCIHVGGSVAHKRWPVERYIELAKRLYEKYKLKTVFVGSKGDSKLLKGFKLNSKFVVNIVSKTNLTDLLAVVKAAKLLIANDSAVGHMAAFWGVPVISIFGGPSNEFMFRPKGEGFSSILKSKCYCTSVEQDHCPLGKNWCMLEINVHSVLSDIDRSKIL